jgi:hypothetical protein
MDSNVQGLQGIEGSLHPLDNSSQKANFSIQHSKNRLRRKECVIRSTSKYYSTLTLPSFFSPCFTQQLRLLLSSPVTCTADLPQRTSFPKSRLPDRRLLEGLKNLLSPNTVPKASPLKWVYLKAFCCVGTPAYRRFLLLWHKRPSRPEARLAQRTWS